MSKALSGLRNAVLGASNLLFINVLRVAAAVQDAQTVTFGDHTFEVDTSVIEGITSGNIRVDLSSLAGASAGTLVIATNPLNGHTVTIGTHVYTFKTTLTASTTADEVLIGATCAASVANLIAAINKAAGGGTTYAAATIIHPTVSAAVGAGDTMGCTAKTAGGAGNLLAATDTLAGSSAFTAATFAGGSDKLVATALIKGTVGDTVASTETCSGTGNQWGGAVLAGGVDATAAQFTAALEDAINGSGVRLLAEQISDNEVLVVDASVTSQQRSKPCTETLAGSNNVWAAANSFGGDQSISPPKLLVTSRVPTATEVTLETMHFALPFVPTSGIVQVRSSTGLVRAFDGKVTLGGNIIDILSDGSVKVQGSDVVTITAHA